MSFREMSFSSPSPKTQNLIPNLKELFARLGKDSTKKCELQEEMHQWRRQYKCSDGKSGKELLEWKSSAVQLNLGRMAGEFLDHRESGSKCNGERFWGSKTPVTEREPLVYPEHRQKIGRILRQIFWRQNEYETRNKKNPNRHHASTESKMPSRDGSAIHFTEPMTTNSPLLSSSLERSLFSPAASSRAARSPIDPPSRAGTPSGQQHHEGRRPRSMQDVMEGSPGSERNANRDDAAESSSDESLPAAPFRDPYEYHGSEDDIRSSQVRHRKKSSLQAPVAKMVATPDPMEIVDPNLAFGEQYPSGPTGVQTPNGPANQTRRGRVPSEEMDETWTEITRKQKRKRTASVRSTASKKGFPAKKQARDENAPREGQTSPSEKAAQQIGLNNGLSSHAYDTAALRERFNESSRPRGPFLDESSQDSTSQSMQALDLTGDTSRPLPGDAPTDEQENVAKPDNDVAHRQNTEDLFLTQPFNTPVPEFRKTDTVGQTSLSPKVDASPKKQLKLSGYMRARVEQPELAGQKKPSEVTEAVDVPQPTVEQDEPAEQEHNTTVSGAAKMEHGSNHERQATMAEREVAQPRLGGIAHPSTPSFNDVLQSDTPGFDDIAQPNQAAPPPTRPLSSIPRPSPFIPKLQFSLPKPGIQILFTVIRSRRPHREQIWGAGGLTGKTMDSLCDEISALIHRPVLRCIHFVLIMSNDSQAEDVIYRTDEPGRFEGMRDVFTKRISKDAKNSGNTRFEICLEPDPQVGEGGPGGGGGSSAADGDLEFNI